MSYQGDRAVTLRDVEAIIDPAVDLANQVEGDNVIIHVFANEDASGGISNTKNIYKVYDQSTKTYGKSVTVDATKNMK